MSKDFYFEKKKNTGTVVVSTILTVILVIIFGGALSFWCGWVDGWFLKVFIGDWLVKGFTIFHINIDKSQIPLMFATISTVAFFIRPHEFLNKDND